MAQTAASTMAIPARMSGLDISKIITAELPYTEFEKGFEMMHSGKSGKVILDWRNVK